MAGLLKKRQRAGAEIPTASMADIAFLLLIFFLVTTTIDVDTGIGMQLPPKLDENVEPPPVNERNMLKVLVNQQGQVLLEDRISSVSLIRDEVKKHVTNNGADPNYAESSDKAIVSIKTDRGTRYDIYIEVLDEVWMAYREIWDSEARQRGYPDYATFRAEMGNDNEIRDMYPAAISEAEPDPAES